MSGYSRSIPQQSRAADQICVFVQTYPDGVTIRRLMADNAEYLKDANSVLAAVDLLVEEGKVIRETHPGQEHYLDSIRIRIA